MTEAVGPRIRATTAERAIEKVIFASRWLLVPFHFGLLLAVLMLLAKFTQTVLISIAHTFSLSGKEAIVASLSMIELALVANLLLMVTFSSYEGFVSRLDAHGQRKERLDWRGQVGFGLLKLRIMASVAAISGVYLLEKVIGAESTQSHNIMWAAAFALFVVASVVLALMERVSER